MNAVFVDSGGWFAYLVGSDAEHAAAHRLFTRARDERRTLVTTNAVLFETHALIVNRARDGRTLALAFLDDVQAGLCEVVRVTKQDERRAIELIRRNTDKDYSFCDALSFVVMEREGVREAIAFDPAAFPRERSPGEGGVGNAMAELTRARRSVWPDRETVRARYASRPPFDVVAPEALDAYLRWGFLERVDGQVELACAPETEAAIYEVSSGPHAAGMAFAHLPALRGRATVFHGAGSYLPSAWFRAQADAAGTALHEVDGGHFFLQEDTARGEALIREALA